MTAPRPDTVDLEPVRAQVELLRWVETRLAELKELQKAARADVEAAMGEHAVGLLDGEDAIHWGHHKRTTFDQKAYAAEHPFDYESYKKTSSVRRFDVLDPPKASDE